MPASSWKLWQAMLGNDASTAGRILPSHLRLICCRVRQFIQALAPGAIIADVGCGNGKYFSVRSDVAVLGSDRSAGLAQVGPLCHM